PRKVSETLTAVTEKPILLNRLQHLAEPWPASVVGAVESSYFWGYLITQLPGGIIANKLSATRAFGLATVISSALNMLLPLAMSASYGFTILIRFLQGLAEGCTYPACLGIWRYWAPPHELSQLANIAFCGSNVGVLFSLLLSGALTESIGWPAPFYIYGGIGILWFALWFLYVSEKPAEHPCISEAERNYIVDSIGDHTDVDAQSCDTPWKSIFTSLPVLAVIVMEIAHGWAFYLLIVEPTKFFCDVFQFDLTQVRLISLNSFGPCFHGNASIVLQSGFVSAMPHLLTSVIVPIGGCTADFLNNGRLATTAVRKLYICFGFGMEAIFLLVAGYSSDARVAVVCLTLAVGFSAIALSGSWGTSPIPVITPSLPKFLFKPAPPAGFNVNLLDLAPRYAGILMGLANGVGSMAGIFLPVATAYMAED
uniref:MFS domain-containing protein n=1 Tax=Macrostomum lignano TaxID=282301 RepID=A0A1I8HZH4_9PLAT